MSTIVDMLQTVEDYQSGETYRVRSRFADQQELLGKVTILDKVDEDVADPIEGV